MARLIGTSVFDPLGDAVGKVHDVVVLLQMRGEPRAVGFVIEVSSRRRVFLPLSRVTAIEPGAVITTGLMNIRRFTQRHVETLVSASCWTGWSPCATDREPSPYGTWPLSATAAWTGR